MGRDRHNAGVPPSQFRQVDEGRQGDRGARGEDEIGVGIMGFKGLT